MKILLLGYGKMGKTIEKILVDRGHEPVCVDTAEERKELSGSFDAAIEFSVPEAAYENLVYCILNNIPVVSGTTGWLEKKVEIEELSREKGTPFFYASNFSIGVNLFFQLNRKFSKVMDRFPGYDVNIHEIHHIHKLDAPSGTAITLAEDTIKHLKRKSEWKLDEGGENTIRITAEREGEVPGTHKVTYIGPDDAITLRHEAFSREGFARGAVEVAEWIPGQRGPLGMEDFLGDLMAGEDK